MNQINNVQHARNMYESPEPTPRRLAPPPLDRDTRKKFQFFPNHDNPQDPRDFAPRKLFQ